MNVIRTLVFTIQSHSSVNKKIFTSTWFAAEGENSNSLLYTLLASFPGHVGFFPLTQTQTCQIQHLTHWILVGGVALCLHEVLSWSRECKQSTISQIHLSCDSKTACTCYCYNIKGYVIDSRLTLLSTIYGYVNNSLTKHDTHNGRMCLHSQEHWPESSPPAQTQWGSSSSYPGQTHPAESEEEPVNINTLK